MSSKKKHSHTRKKSILQLTSNPGLALTSFRATRHWSPKSYNMKNVSSASAKGCKYIVDSSLDLTEKENIKVFEQPNTNIINRKPHQKLQS